MHQERHYEKNNSDMMVIRKWVKKQLDCSFNSFLETKMFLHLLTCMHLITHKMPKGTLSTFNVILAKGSETGCCKQSGDYSLLWYRGLVDNLCFNGRVTPKATTCSGSDNNNNSNIIHYSLQTMAGFLVTHSITVISVNGPTTIWLQPIKLPKSRLHLNVRMIGTKTQFGDCQLKVRCCRIMKT